MISVECSLLQSNQFKYLDYSFVGTCEGNVLMSLYYFDMLFLHMKLN